MLLDAPYPHRRGGYQTQFFHSEWKRKRSTSSRALFHFLRYHVKLD